MTAALLLLLVFGVGPLSVTGKRVRLFADPCAGSLLPSSSSCSQETPRTFNQWRLFLETRLRPLEASLDSMVAVLRADPQSSLADSAFLRFKSDFSDQVRILTNDLYDGAFQIAAYPDGFPAQRQRRALGIPLSSLHDIPPSDSARADSLMTFLRTQAVWAGKAEGYVYLAANQTTLLERLGPYLTDPMVQFQELFSLEQRVPTGGDAAVFIPWDSLGARVAAAERLISIASNEQARDILKEQHTWYLRPYLSGWPNTPAFDWGSGILLPEVRKSFQWFLTEFGGTSTGSLVSEYLEVLRQEDFRKTERVQAFLVEKAGIGIH